MHDIEHLPGIFTLGYIGENEFRTIEIDMSAWLEKIPNGVASIVHIRPGESSGDAYLAITSFEDGILRWPITMYDLGNYEGYGSMQISLTGTNANGTKVGESEIVRTRVNGSAMDSGGDVPSAQKGWMDQMNELLANEQSLMDKTQTLVDGIERFPVITYLECSSWEYILGMWTKPGSNVHNGQFYGLKLSKPDDYDPRENDLLMIRMKADLKTPGALVKYYLSFDNEQVDPETGIVIAGDGERYLIDNMQTEYDPDITLFEKDHIYAFRYHTKRNGQLIVGPVYDVINYAPGVKEFAAKGTEALAEAQAVLDGAAIRFDEAQSLTETQKQQARDNINAAKLVDGKVPSSQLPSYVDDVVEASTRNAFPAVGESSKIYVDRETNLTYRWSGSAYVEISPSLGLGETASTAFAGNRGVALEQQVGAMPNFVYAETTSITSDSTYRRINVNVPNGYSPDSGDYLAVKFTVDETMVARPVTYMLHYNYNGSVITNDVAIMNFPPSGAAVGTKLFDNGNVYLFRHKDEDECLIIGYRSGVDLGETSTSAFPGDRGKQLEDDFADLEEDVTELVSADIENIIKVQDTQPTEPKNKMWVKETPDEEIQVPTVAEMEAALTTKVNSTDMQAALALKIDKPETNQNGNYDQILRTNGDGTTRWDNAATATEITNAVDTYLEANFTNPSSPPLDRGLTSSQSAAPADLVGNLAGLVVIATATETRTYLGIT